MFFVYIHYVENLVRRYNDDNLLYKRVLVYVIILIVRQGHSVYVPAIFKTPETVAWASLQSMVSLDKILCAPTVPHYRCRCAKSVQKIIRCTTTLWISLHKDEKSEGRLGALS